MDSCRFHDNHFLVSHQNIEQVDNPFVDTFAINSSTAAHTTCNRGEDSRSSRDRVERVGWSIRPVRLRKTSSSHSTADSYRQPFASAVNTMPAAATSSTVSASQVNQNDPTTPWDPIKEPPPTYQSQFDYDAASSAIEIEAALPPHGHRCVRLFTLLKFFSADNIQSFSIDATAIPSSST